MQAEREITEFQVHPKKSHSSPISQEIIGIDTEINNQERNYNFIKCKWVILSCVLVVGLGLSVSLPIVLNNSSLSRVRSVRVNQINSAIQLIQREIAIIEGLLSRSNKIMEVTRARIPNTEYHDFMLLETTEVVDNIESIRFAPFVKREDISTYEDHCRLYVEPTCKLKTFRNTNGRINITGPLEIKPLYAPVTFYAPPGSLSPTIIGLDVMSTGGGFSPIIPLLDQNITSATRPLILTSITEPNSFGVFIGKKSDIGYSLGSIVVKQLFNSALESTDVRQNSKINVYDFESGLLFTESNITDEIDIVETRNIIKQTMNFYNRQWNLYFIFDEDVPRSLVDNSVIVMASVLPIITVLTSLFVVLYINYSQNHTARIAAETDTIVANRMVEYVNHEVRNPLNGIIGLVDITKTELEDINVEIQHLRNVDPLISNLDTSLRLCLLLRHIVNDILDIRKLKEQKVDLCIEPIELHKIMGEVKKMIQYRLDEKFPVCEFVVDIQLPNPTSIMVDQTRLMQILINFLTNAIKFTDNGTITLRAKFTDDSELNGSTPESGDNKQITIEVIDTGRGIKDNRKNFIFEPFSQMEYEDSSRYGGIGLGLHLCKLLAKLMNLNIGFESEYGVGSTFYIKYNGEVHFKAKQNRSIPTL